MYADLCVIVMIKRGIISHVMFTIFPDFSLVQLLNRIQLNLK